ncbi:MAG: heat-inducible transcription repressor HrcA [Clostridia bacterium]|nr:heat-inducible transcription repressor HrcA [Clostridia bacterium]
MELDERKRKILEVVIEEYSATAEPVGSLKLSKDLGVSSATIRNEMAALEKLGLLEHTHTSSGRIPTTEGYRWYVDQIVSKNTLLPKEKASIDKMLSDEAGKLENLIKEATSLLSKLTNYASYSVSPEIDDCTVEEIKLVKLGTNKLMIILLADNGMVKETVINNEGQIPDQNIEIFNNYLNYKLRGMNFRDIYDNIAPYIESELNNINDNIVPLLVELNGLLASDTEVHVDGASNMLALPELKKSETLKKFLNVIETKDALKELVKTGYDGNINIYIGQETSFDDLKDFTIITYKQKINDKEVGTIGIIGPKRMNYKKVIPTIKYIGDMLQKKLEKNEGGNKKNANKRREQK